MEASMARWLDTLAMRWLGRRHGWPVRAGREFFYEPDQPLEEIERAWYEGTGFTTAPPISYGIYIGPSSSQNVVVRDNRILPGP